MNFLDFITNSAPDLNIAELGNPTDREVIVQLDTLGSSKRINIGNTANPMYEEVIQEAAQKYGITFKIDTVKITTNLDVNQQNVPRRVIEAELTLIIVVAGEHKGNG